MKSLPCQGEGQYCNPCQLGTTATVNLLLISVLPAQQHVFDMMAIGTAPCVNAQSTSHSPQSTEPIQVNPGHAVAHNVQLLPESYLQLH